MHGSIPSTLSDISYCGIEAQNNVGYASCTDQQTHQQYEYVLVGQSAKAYQLCAVFNEPLSQEAPGTSPYGSSFLNHPAGHYCFNEAIPASDYIQNQAQTGTKPAVLPY